jgi:hypothetical protein
VFGTGLVALLVMAAAAGALAWRVPRLGRDWRWSAGARTLGLVVSGERRAWGQLGGHELAIRWTDGPHATVVLGATGSLERLPDVRNRIGAEVALGHAGLPSTPFRWKTADEAQECARIGVAALQDLPSTGRLVLGLSARAGDEERLLVNVARMAVWIADELGWGTAPARARTPEPAPRRTEPPALLRRSGDPEEDRERLVERLTELRARAPAGTLHR